MVTLIPPSRRRSIRSRRGYQIHRLLLVIHPLLLVALVVVIVASLSLVVVAVRVAEERQELPRIDRGDDNNDVVLLRQSKVFQCERHSVYGR